MMTARSAFYHTSSNSNNIDYIYSAPSPPPHDDFYVWTELTAAPTTPLPWSTTAATHFQPQFHPHPHTPHAYAAYELDGAAMLQHLRFPTPPITPPRLLHTAVPSAPPTAAPPMSGETALRTQSVIMKASGSVTTATAVSAVAYSVSSASGSGSDSSSPCSAYLCEWLGCSRYFDSLDTLAAHVTQVHAIASPADGLYYCRWRDCQRSERGFNARYKMLVHTRTHTKEKPHTCHLCAKCFSRAENLKIHIRSHSGEKPYVCIYAGCNKSYSNSSDRFKHTRTHAIDKPYCCKVAGCQKRYTDPSSLRKHVKTFQHAHQLLLPGDGAALEQAQSLPPLGAADERVTPTTPAFQQERFKAAYRNDDAAADYSSWPAQYAAAAFRPPTPVAAHPTIDDVEMTDCRHPHYPHHHAAPLDLRLHRR